MTSLLQKEIIEQLRALKKSFRSLDAASREVLSVALLKCNLGVNTSDELRRVQQFIGDFTLKLLPGKLDDFMNYLHAADETLPPFLPMHGQDMNLPKYEGDDSDTIETMRDVIRDNLPAYEDDQAETLRESALPLDSTKK